MQGKIDAMCGVYSIINSLLYLDCIENQDEAEKLFKKIIKREAEIFPIAFYDGMNFKNMKHLLDNEIGRRKDIQYYRPIKREISIYQFLNRLEEELPVSRKTAAILGLGRPLHHWTVVTKISNNKGKRTLHLFDSYLGKTKIPQEKLCSSNRGQIPPFYKPELKIPKLTEVYTNELFIIHKK